MKKFKIFTIMSLLLTLSFQLINVSAYSISHVTRYSDRGQFQSPSGYYATYVASGVFAEDGSGYLGEANLFKITGNAGIHYSYWTHAYAGGDLPLGIYVYGNASAPNDYTNSISRYISNNGKTSY